MSGSEEESAGDTQRVVVNHRFGGFGLSDEAATWLIENRDWSVTMWNEDGEFADPDADLCDRKAGPHGEDSTLGGRFRFIQGRRDGDLRSDPDLADCVEELGDAADGRHARLDVVEVPADVDWVITEYDGAETLREAHRTFPSGELAEGVANSYEGDDSE